MAWRNGSRKELIVDVEPEPGSTGHEGGQIFTRDTASVESSLRYRATSSEVTEMDSPDGAEGFVEVETRDPIAIALEQCEKWVLGPYRLLLKMLGWTQLSKDGDTAVLKLARVALVMFWVLAILLTFITQILTCFRRDSFATTPMDNSGRQVMCQKHIISSYILPDLLLLASYFFGLYLFSKGETEYLSNLADRAFVKGTQAKLNFNKKLIFTIFGFFLIALVWIVLSFCVRLMTSFALDLWNANTTIYWNTTEFNGAGKDTLLVFSLVGFVFFDLVYVGAVINYAAQSEMNIYLLRAIRRMVVQKFYEDIDAGIKDILECRQYLRVLNGKTATAAALIMFNLASAGVLAIISLNDISKVVVQQYYKDLATVASGFNVILWMGLVFFPFIQAARVSHAAQELKGAGVEIRARPLQYSKTPQIELDSFVGLTNAVKLRATMFGIPVYPWLVWFIITAFSFTTLILFQTGLYNFTPYL